MTDKIAKGTETLKEILSGMPSKNGEKHRKKKLDRMTKKEVADWLRILFNITDQLSVDVVWEHMEEIWAEEDGEC